MGSDLHFESLSDNTNKEYNHITFKTMNGNISNSFLFVAVKL